MRLRIVLAVAALALAQPAMAKDTRFWNLTSSTVKSLELAPVATNAFGPNQCLNDPDSAVDHDERVKVDRRRHRRVCRAADVRGQPHVPRAEHADRGRQGFRHRGKGPDRLHEMIASRGSSAASRDGSRRREAAGVDEPDRAGRRDDRDGLALDETAKAHISAVR